MFQRIFFLILLNTFFIISLWHLDINHNLDRVGEKKTRGVFKIPAEKGYRISQYGLILGVLLFDIFILYLLLY